MRIKDYAIHFAVALSLGVAGCGDTPAVSQLDIDQTGESLLLGNGKTLWNGATTSNLTNLGQSAAINVCFYVAPRTDANGTQSCAGGSTTTDCSGASYATTTGRYTGSATTVRNALRNHVREVWERTWLTHANVELYGFGDCPTTNGRHYDTNMAGMIAVQLNSATSPSFCGGDGIDCSGLGKSSSGPTAMQLNWPAINSDASGNNRFNVIHEMGHALGFSHEWLREDWTLTTNDGSEAGNYLGTAANDNASIMDYSITPNPSELSSWDILGVQRAYGRKSTGSLVGDWASCANVQGANTANGTPIISYPCRNEANDRFLRPGADLHLKSAGLANRCMNIQTDVGANPLISWECTSTANEDFVFSSVEWRAMGNMCVHRNGSALELRTCNNSSAQKWDFFTSPGAGATPYWQIKQPGGSNCVQAQTTNGALGEQLTMTTCSASSRQRFSFPGSGRVTYNNNQQFCANVSGGLPTSGSPIILWDGCGANPIHNAQFYLHGRVKVNSANYCMDAQGRGAQVKMSTCSSADPQQVWDYYL